jgi:hypothetical protein
MSKELFPEVLSFFITCLYERKATPVFVMTVD